MNSEIEWMLKLGRGARGHFVTLIEIEVNLIRCISGHTCRRPDDSDFVARSEELSLIGRRRSRDFSVVIENQSREKNDENFETNSPFHG